MDKRRYQRLDIDHPATLLLKDGTKADCRIQNFSYGGLFLATDETQTLNASVNEVARLEIPTQTSSETIQTKIVHASNIGLGIAFVSREDALLHYLQRISATKDSRDNTNSYPRQQILGTREITIIDWIHAATNRHIRSRYPQFIESALNSLFDAANHADSDKMQSLLFDAYNTLQNSNNKIESALLNNINSGFKKLSTDSISNDESPNQQDEQSEMGLVAKEDFEEWVSVVSLTRNLEPEISYKLHQLETSLSFLTQRHITNERNPVSPYSLLWSFKKSISDFDITLQAKKIIFSSFQDKILGDIDNLYDEANLHLDKQGIAKKAKEAHPKAQQRSSTTRHAHTSKLLTDTLSSLIGLTTNKDTSSKKQSSSKNLASKEAIVESLANISASGQRPIIQKIEEQLSHGSTPGGSGMVDSEIRQTIQVTEQILGSLQQDSCVNQEIRGLIDSLKIPLVKEAINDPMLLNDKDHPGHKLLNAIGKLGPYLPSDDQEWLSKGGLYEAIEEISRLAEQGAQLDIRLVTDHLERIIDQRREALKSNLGIVTQSCERDEQYMAARNYVFGLLCSKLTQGEIPIVVEQLLHLGWAGLLVHIISTFGKDDKKAIRLSGVIDLLLDIFKPGQEIKPKTPIQNSYLIKVIKEGFASYPPHADDAKQFLNEIEAILASEGSEHADIACERVRLSKDDIRKLLNQQSKPQPDEDSKPSIEQAWLDLVDGIKLDDWIVEQRQQGRVRMLNLAWKNNDSTRYAFVDGEGNKQLDTKRHTLASMFKQQQCSLLEDGNIPIVERAVDRLLKNTFEQIKRDNDTDDLTGLLRRNAFQKKISELLEITNDAGDSHVMLKLDIDNFSRINRQCGHNGGDKLIQTFASIISNYLPEHATLARIGSDEFGVLIMNCSLDEGFQAAETLRRALNNLNFTWDGTTIPATTSVGVVHIDANINSATDIMNMASSAGQLAIVDGGNCTRIYKASIHDAKQQDEISAATSIVDDTLSNQKVSLFAQPISSVFMADSAEHHYEILLRLKNNDGTWRGPDEFIQAAEKHNRMQSVDRWVINKVFAWLENHHSEINNTSISINLSAQTMDDESFFTFISNHLKTTPFPNNKITFEITETSLIKHIEKARMLVEMIRDKGCRFSLDDFGTGYASYSYLKDFPVDYVKIDGAFIRDILTDSSSYAMVKSITEISHHMGKKVIAEYVESEAELIALRELEVDFAQGYYIGHPVPIRNLIQPTL